MKKNYTLNDLILFAYNETDSVNKNLISKTIKSNKKLNTQYKSILKVKKALNSINVSPGKNVINNILNYSRALNILNSKAIGNISLILN